MLTPLQLEARFCPESEIHFRIRPSLLYLPPPSQVDVLVSAHTTFSLSTKTSPPPPVATGPKLIWISKQIPFLICIWMRARSADIHYRAWLCGLGHKSGLTAVPGRPELLCANWFFAASICPQFMQLKNGTQHIWRKMKMQLELRQSNKIDKVVFFGEI